MLEVFRRMHMIQGLDGKSRTTGFQATDFETIALNFRKIAELIVYASLAGHEDEYAALHPSYQSQWRIGQIMKRIKDINPYYFPVPTKHNSVEDEFGYSSFEILPAGTWMTEDELIGMYEKCGDILHAQNSFQTPRSLTEYPILFKTWYSKLRELLSHHNSYLLGPGILLVCQMNATYYGNKPKVSIFKDITDKAPKKVLNHYNINLSDWPSNDKKAV